MVPAMSPAVACSPPTARSPAMPIGSRGSARSFVPRVSSDGGNAEHPGTSPLPRGAPRFSFSSSYTTSSVTRSLSVASTGGATAQRPPAGPSAVKAQHVLVGFEAPISDSHGPAAGPMSPGRRETKPSLLSLALSDLPPVGAPLTFPSAHLDIFGTPSPSAGFLRQVRVCAAVSG